MARKILRVKNYIPMERMKQMSFKELKEAGLIRESRVISHLFREEAEQLRDQGLSLDEIKRTLGDKYFLSVASIHAILYKPIGWHQ